MINPQQRQRRPPRSSAILHWRQRPQRSRTTAFAPTGGPAALPNMVPTLNDSGIAATFSKVRRD